MKTRITALAMLLAIASALLIAPFSASAAPSTAKSSAVQVPVTGTAADGVVFEGVYTINRFAVQGGQLVAVGTLTGTLTDVLGNVLGTVTQAVAIPVAADGSCQILHLELGPLDLDLLGLQVHLDQVVLDITAQSGAGNLLGNLLCAVAGLLDSNGALSSIARLLNQILGQL